MHLRKHKSDEWVIPESMVDKKGRPLRRATLANSESSSDEQGEYTDTDSSSSDRTVIYDPNLNRDTHFFKRERSNSSSEEDIPIPQLQKLRKHYKSERDDNLKLKAMPKKVKIKSDHDTESDMEVNSAELHKDKIKNLLLAVVNCL